MKNVLIYFTVSLFVTLLGCTADNIHSCSFMSPVTSVDAPGSGIVGDSLTFTVMHTFDNTCGEFERYDIFKSGNTFSITICAAYNGGSSCTDNTIQSQTPYLFVPREAGTYRFRFNQGEEYLVREVVVD